MQKSVATRYAKGLFEVAKSHTTVDAYLAHFEDLQKGLNESRELRAILDNPAVPFEKRHGLVRAIGEKSGWDRYFCNFVCILIDRNRLKLVDEIAASYLSLCDESKGLIRLEIISARPLGEIEVQKLVKAVSGQALRKVEVSTKVDPNLIGGAIARLGEKVYDASIRSQLEKVKNTILQSV